MEGISHEAASLAGHLGLGRLVVLWDDNSITIDGAVNRSSSDDQTARFAAYGWHTQEVADGTDVDAVDAAIARAKADPRPSLIAVRTIIGHGAPGVAGTSKAHGSPLGEELAAEAMQLAGWEHPPFSVPEPVRVACHCAGRGRCARTRCLAGSVSPPSRPAPRSAPRSSIAVWIGDCRRDSGDALSRSPARRLGPPGSRPRPA